VKSWLWSQEGRAARHKSLTRYLKDCDEKKYLEARELNDKFNETIDPLEQNRIIEEARKLSRDK